MRVSAKATLGGLLFVVLWSLQNEKMVQTEDYQNEDSKEGRRVQQDLQQSYGLILGAPMSLRFYNKSFSEVILEFLKPFGGCCMQLKQVPHYVCLIWEPLLSSTLLMILSNWNALHNGHCNNRSFLIRFCYFCVDIYSFQFLDIKQAGVLEGGTLNSLEFKDPIFIFTYLFFQLRLWVSQSQTNTQKGCASVVGDCVVFCTFSWHGNFLEFGG